MLLLRSNTAYVVHAVYLSVYGGLRLTVSLSNSSRRVSSFSVISLFLAPCPSTTRLPWGLSRLQDPRPTAYCGCSVRSLVMLRARKPFRGPLRTMYAAAVPARTLLRALAPCMRSAYCSKSGTALRTWSACTDTPSTPFLGINNPVGRPIFRALFYIYFMFGTC